MFYVNGWRIERDSRPFGPGAPSGWRATRDGMSRGAPTLALLRQSIRKAEVTTVRRVVVQLRLPLAA